MNHINNLPTDIIELIYLKLHRMYMSDLLDEMLDPDQNYIPSDDSDDSYDSD